MQRFKELLREEGVELDQLVICMLGGAECIIGEYVDRIGEESLAGNSFYLQNPKRVMRRQEQRGTVASIIFYIADLDLISGGTMEIQPVAVSAVKWLNIDSQISYAGLYLIYIEQQKESRMEKSGLIKPPVSLPPHLLRPDLR